ncbi:ComF family protein [Legionella sp. km772]|uniref:ComF family protein n=1 Tax=Legionella sp. km772 TaxID=2498111 RepID=UPI000F8DFF66|nr:ComF family protein [Legionella sp. km772]RUR05778.1 ComF family protein [Legionella sp. km772]
MRHKLLSIAQRIRLPSICILCNQFHPTRLAVCDFCIALFPSLGPSCKYCAFPLPDEGYLICGHCIKQPPYFNNATIAYSFEEPLRGLLHRFKYQNGLYLSSLLAQLIINAWKKQPSTPQCLIPVPMHPKKIKSRGFNQTIIIAQLLSKRLKIPIDFISCQKKLHTPAQAELNGKKRSQNIKNAFSVAPSSYKHIALIDDLLTTGSTVNELAKVLKKSGVQQVDIWCCARAVKKTL